MDGAAYIGLPALVLLVALALSFDFLNGFHDAANSLATLVSTGVLKPRQAVLWAAFFNVAALFVFQMKVAATVGTGIVTVEVVDAPVIGAALTAAILWTLLTWYFGIPISASHALIGGLAGAALAKAGPAALLWSGAGQIVLFLFLSPVLGFMLGGLILLALAWLSRHQLPRRMDRLFRRLQLLSAALYSLGHGGNDAQKTIGVIWMLLIAAGLSRGDADVPFWVVLFSHLAMGLGTLFGGWRIVRTMGQRLTRLTPLGGFCAESSGALTLFLATSLGVPVSTTHTITAAIVGVGATRRLSAVRWPLARGILATWLATLPICAALAALTWLGSVHLLG
jgi:PiT family inorganic phosphate transporter